MNTNHFQDVKDYILDQLDDGVGLDQYGGDLHHELLNTNYFFVYTNQAKQWLGDCYSNAIQDINEYEDFNFGERSTDTSDPAKVANMWAYIKGEEILNACAHVVGNSNRYLNEYTLEIITAEVKAV